MKNKTKTERDDKLVDANQKLRGQVKRLRKQIKLLQDELEIRTTSEDAPEIVEECSRKRKCPECTDTLNTINAGIYRIHACPSCGWKKRYSSV